MTRTLVAWCPDWPLTAAGVPPERAAAVLVAHRVVVCSAAARRAGVRVGLRQREAQSRCPEVVVLDADPVRDARAFDPVTAAVADLAPAVQVLRPGLLALDLRGPGRVLGGEVAVAGRVRATVDDVTRTVAADLTTDRVGVTACRTGTADGRFAAVLAARHTSASDRDGAVPPGGDATFLAGHGVEALLHATTLGDEQVAGRELVELLRRLGIATLGDLAALPRAVVAERFGHLGARAHRLAAGDDDRRVVPLARRPELTVRAELDPPAQLVEAAAFRARGLADELLAVLRRHSLTCVLVTIEAETEHGETLARRWRAHDGFTAAALVDRVRWQLDGWSSGTGAAAAPTAAIAVLRLVPEEVFDGGRQGSLLERPDRDAPQVARALARLQGMLGPDAVLLATAAEGREPADWMSTRPWGETPDPSACVGSGHGARPWPGRIPPPAPATVPPRPVPAEVVDDTGEVVGVSGRGAVSATPHRWRVGTGPWRQVVAWAGPWLADERWWDAAGRRRARFQLAGDDGEAALLSVEQGRWHLEAIYD